jgi:hypothetical protein
MKTSPSCDIYFIYPWDEDALSSVSGEDGYVIIIKLPNPTSDILPPVFILLQVAYTRYDAHCFVEQRDFKTIWFPQMRI